MITKKPKQLRICSYIYKPTNIVAIVKENQNGTWLLYYSSKEFGIVTINTTVNFESIISESSIYDVIYRGVYNE